VWFASSALEARRVVRTISGGQVIGRRIVAFGRKRWPIAQAGERGVDALLVHADFGALQSKWWFVIFADAQGLPCYTNRLRL
jgi:hypothetical protein